jgi:hypothetical protein
MHLMKSSFDDPMAAVPSLQHRVMPDPLLCRGGSTCDRLQWSHWLAFAPVASFFTQKSHARRRRMRNQLISLIHPANYGDFDGFDSHRPLEER